MMDLSVSRLKFWTGDSNQSINLFLLHIFKQLISRFSNKCREKKIMFQTKGSYIQNDSTEFELGVAVPKLNSLY